MSEKNIYQRINDVMKKVDYVKKDKSISGGGANYKAVTHDQVISVARKALVENGIVIYPEQLDYSLPIMRDLEKNIKMHLYSGWYLIHFVNIDSPEDRISVKINAMANDNGDKAPGKALSYASKTVFLKVFCLETGENDESREEQRDINLISGDQCEQLYKLLCDENGMFTEKGVGISKAFKFNNLNEIKAKKFNEILRYSQ